jgi:hypothetical protein
MTLELNDLLVQNDATEPDPAPHFAFQLRFLTVKRGALSKQAQPYGYTSSSTNHVPTAIGICSRMQINTRE